MKPINHVFRFTAFCCLLLPPQLLFAQTTWTGTSNTNWADPTNWSAGVPDAADDVTIPNTANDPVIMGGTAAVAKSVMVDVDAALTIQALGSLAIDDPATQSLANGGTVINHGLLTIGAVTSGGSYGLVNGGTFTNMAGGTVRIERCTNIALWNYVDGMFSNAGQLVIEASGANTGPGIYNESSFQNTGNLSINEVNTGLNNRANSSFINSGTVTIRPGGMFGSGPCIYNFSIVENNTGGLLDLYPRSAGIDNRLDASFTNNADISIFGQPINFGAGPGIYNQGLLLNGATAHIQIDSVRSAGIHNSSTARLENAGKISIALRGTLIDSSPAIDNYSDFRNQVNAEIIIDSVNSSGIVHRQDTFINAGKIFNGPTAQYTGYPLLYSTAVFINTATGTIQLEGYDGEQAAIHTESSGPFFNAGTINIGMIRGNNKIGFTVQGEFENSGFLNIDRIRTANFNDNGIYISAFNKTIVNTGKITIGSTVSGGVNGIYIDRGNFNNSGGEISIDHLNNDNFSHGLRNSGGNLSTVSNSGKITIGDSGGGSEWGLWNDGAFNNNAGGEIYIDRSTITALQNNSNTFTNAGKITIGSKANIGNWGLYSTGVFNNSGEVQIDRATISALRNELNTFSNSGKIALGNSASVGDWGLWNEATFQNQATGEISINRSPNTGLHNSVGPFTNAGTIRIGPDVSLLGLANYNNFTNEACAVMDIQSGAVNNQSTVTNHGLMTINTALAHTNAGTFTNNGILEYPQGNPVPGVVNQDIIVQPASGGCPVPGVVTIGGDNNFTPAGAWYKDEALTDPAGTYDDGANTFYATDLTNGVHTLYFSIADDNNDCPRTVSIELTLNGQPDCSIDGPAGAVCAFSEGNTYSAPAGMDSYSWSIEGDGSIQGATNGQSISVAAGASGSYTVTVAVNLNGCGSSCAETSNISTISYQLVATSAYCQGEPGPALSLTGSEPGASYQLQTGGGDNLGTPVAGTGGALSFGAYPNGSYQVLISGGNCPGPLKATAAATAVACAIAVPDFCSCNSQGGYTDVAVKVSAPDGQNWTVKNVIGLYSGSGPYIPLAIGTPLNPLGNDMYALPAARANNKGYWVQLTNGVTDLNIQVGNPGW
ncbi:MAG: hypothetical protein R3D58_09300 [Saprospiraceae bacterium]